MFFFLFCFLPNTTTESYPRKACIVILRRRHSSSNCQESSFAVNFAYSKGLSKTNNGILNYFISEIHLCPLNQLMSWQIRLGRIEWHYFRNKHWITKPFASTSSSQKHGQLLRRNTSPNWKSTPLGFYIENFILCQHILASWPCSYCQQNWEHSIPFTHSSTLSTMDKDFDQKTTDKDHQ